MNKRIQYLDLLKSISIFLVVSCHFVLLAETFSSNVLMALCRLAVPVFFMVNGVLLFSRPLNIKSHFKKTFIIYLVQVAWKLIYMLTVPSMTGGTLQAGGTGEILSYLFFFGELSGIINGHLWFINVLLAVYLLFPAFRIVYDYENDSSSGVVLLWILAISSLLLTSGLHSIEIIGRMLRDIGISFTLSFSSLSTFQPFGLYGNMLGFFLLGALLGGPRTTTKISIRPFIQRTIGAILLILGVAGFLLVRRYLCGHFLWDGVPMPEGYNQVSVISMAVGLFILCKDIKLNNPYVAKFINGLASRTLGFYYLHWFFGWMLNDPLVLFLNSLGMEFSLGTNLLKTVSLMLASFIVILVLERIPIINKLVR